MIAAEKTNFPVAVMCRVLGVSRTGFHNWERRALDRYEAAQEELALVSATTKHDATRVGAIRTRLDALAAQANLLMLVGVLPRDLGQLRQDVDVRDLAQRTLAVFDAYDVPVEAKRELLLVLNGNGHLLIARGVNKDRHARRKRWSGGPRSLASWPEGDHRRGAPLKSPRQ